MNNQLTKNILFSLTKKQPMHLTPLITRGHNSLSSTDHCHKMLLLLSLYCESHFSNNDDCVLLIVTCFARLKDHILLKFLKKRKYEYESIGYIICIL